MSHSNESYHGRRNSIKVINMVTNLIRFQFFEISFKIEGFSIKIIFVRINKIPVRRQLDIFRPWSTTGFMIITAIIFRY